MGQPWYVRLGRRLCELTGHLVKEGKPWEYDGYVHYCCKLCGMLVSKEIK